MCEEKITCRYSTSNMVFIIFRYLKTTYLEHCVPWSVSSGLSGLPLTHVYINGSKTSQSTHSFLPTGQPLNGSKAYENIMSYFTTSDITPDEVYELGYKMINKLYPQVVHHCSLTNHSRAIIVQLSNGFFYIDQPISEEINILQFPPTTTNVTLALN